ncbi:hypothetical protein [Rheinheimera sediminis]|uniref:hypothetical protein n=1 Tax=Rheinheimera sp. YQF-1 TaxID=2499626 RepID=UPI0021BD8210|nr:hypothetical protein [Rheinheimera sp. YQF-1]
MNYQEMTTGYSFKNPEMIIAGSALIVSLITAFVSIYSAFIDRAYARASVWPRVEIQRSYNDSRSFFYYIVSNKGTGPAVIKHARLSFDNKAVKSWPDYLKMRSGRTVGHVQSHIGSIVLSSGESTKPLELHDTEVAKLLADQDNLQIELCYCSIYDECWTVQRDNNPTPIAQCTIEDKERFLQ